MLAKFMKDLTATPASGTKILRNGAAHRDIKPEKYTCGTPPAQNVPKNMAKTMW
jgi:hypothetical protein